MLTRRACSNVRGILPTSRPATVPTRSFAAGAITQTSNRAPALADITPDAAASFNRKQKEFRDGLVAAQKQKEQQESGFISDSMSASGTCPDGCATINCWYLGMLT
jgi:hypothetical protein